MGVNKEFSKIYEIPGSATIMSEDIIAIPSQHEINHDIPKDAFN